MAERWGRGHRPARGRARRGAALLQLAAAISGMGLTALVGFAVEHIIGIADADLWRVALAAGGGVASWVAVNTWLNGKKLSRICAIVEGEQGLGRRVENIEQRVGVMASGLEPKLAETRHAVAGRVQGMISDMELRLTDRVERLENRIMGGHQT